MADVLIASDEQSIHDQVCSVLSRADTSVRRVSAGKDVLGAVRQQVPDLVVLDLQIGNMGGVATCLDLRLEEGAGRLPHIPVLMLLDRRADVFLARRSDVDGWLVKPLDAIRLRKAITSLLAGGTYYDESYRPPGLGPDAVGGAWAGAGMGSPAARAPRR